MSSKVEEKLFQNRYLVDEGNVHVRLRWPDAVPSDALRSLVECCPAGCWSLEEDGRVVPTLDGCLECGSCRLLTAHTHELIWDYPRGGFGVAYKFG